MVHASRWESPAVTETLEIRRGISHGGGSIHGSINSCQRVLGLLSDHFHLWAPSGVSPNRSDVHAGRRDYLQRHY